MLDSENKSASQNTSERPEVNYQPVIEPAKTSLRNSHVLPANISSSPTTHTLLVLGTRGIPASHGGFETFAQQLALYLNDHGWTSKVYCQASKSTIGTKLLEDSWNGIQRVLIPSRDLGSIGSIMYDLRCVLDASRRTGVILLLGYNTAIFSVVLWALRREVIINMDGLEWKRPKWSRMARAWLWANERIAAKIGRTLVADHPEIKNHLTRTTCQSKVIMIPYGAPVIEEASTQPLATLNLESGDYYLSIARIEPENSQLEIIKAFSQEKRDKLLVILGTLSMDNPYHRAIRAAAGESVRFIGAIYDKTILASLRYHAAAYFHGHTVGGTNPSLVEALGAGCPIVAHDNEFNRWTAGPDQLFFRTEQDFAEILRSMAKHPELLEQMRHRARQRHRAAFQLEAVLGQYRQLLESHV
jgi:glycosyltransferase involved in cell wall biosynthesis